MTSPVLPAGLEGLRSYLDGLERRIGLLEQPQEPGAVYACLKAKLPDAKTFYGCVAWVTDTNILVHSDGTHWISEKTGSAV